MAFQAVKGTRDFYPELMRVRNFITDAWRRVSLRNGFEEYDAPIFEYLDLFTAKSGPEIAEQLFGFTDRGGRQLAIRPEITPSLARMVNAKINALPRPIKWFSSPRVCRAENPQKGRLREFFQWNIDIIGEETEIADAECLYVAVDAFRELGLGAADVQLRYSSRAVLSAVLAAMKLPAEQVQPVMGVLDKRKKIPAEAFAEMLAKTVSDDAARAAINTFMDIADLPALSAEELASRLGVPASPELAAAMGKLASFNENLGRFGIGEWCRYDPAVVRGLAYYTGVVYEAFDAGQSLRAVAGGGRYDNLLEVLGGPKVGGCGFGMGDVVLGILLEEKGKLPPLTPTLDFFLVDGEGAFEPMMQLLTEIRSRGWAADFSYKRQATGKQLNQANKRGAKAAMIVKSAQAVSIKNLASGAQKDTDTATLLSTLKTKGQQGLETILP